VLPLWEGSEDAQCSRDFGRTFPSSIYTSQTMPPRISPSRLTQPSTCECFRSRPRNPPAVRDFHASARHEVTRLRRGMYDWLKGPGKVFRKPLRGSTNYLSAYNKTGDLVRVRKDNRDDRTKPGEGIEEDETAASERDQNDQSLTDDDRDMRAREREMARQTRKAEDEETEARGGVPRERSIDMRPYPLNQHFTSQPVLSEALREQLYVQVAVEERDLSSVAASFGVDIRRVAAAVRLKTIEKQWEDEVSDERTTETCIVCTPLL